MARTAEQILAEHAAWARGEGGTRIVWVDMPEDERANLRGANLSRADLSSANLSGADLSRAKHCVELPLADPRGYRLIAVAQSDTAAEWLLYSGCRGPWTVAQARAHWEGKAYQGDPLTARRYSTALDWWEQYGADYRAAAKGDE